MHICSVLGGYDVLNGYDGLHWLAVMDALPGEHGLTVENVYGAING